MDNEAIMTNFKLPDFTLPAPLARLGNKLPQLPPTLALVTGLNLALGRLIPREPLEMLVGKRFTIRVKDAGMTLRFGYMEEHDVPGALRQVPMPGGPLLPRESTWFLGRETLLPRRKGLSGMPLWRERLFAVLAKNAQNATSFFGLPPERVFEVGHQVEI